MKNSFLYDFLRGDIIIEKFKKYIAADIKNYKKQLQKEGSSVILSIDDDLNFPFKKEYLIKLCNHYLNKELNSWELQYIVDCILFMDDAQYEDIKLIDLLESITDSKVNGDITKETIVELKREVNCL